MGTRKHTAEGREGRVAPTSESRNILTEAPRAALPDAPHAARTRDQPIEPDVGEAEARALKLYVVLYRAAGAVAAVARKDIARHGLTPAEFGMMEALFHRGPMLLSEVQRKILVSSGGMTYLVDRLAGRGLVERRACAEDRRASYAALTDSGERFMRAIFPAHAAAIRQAVAGLDPDAQAALTDLLRTLGHHASTVVVRDAPSEAASPSPANAHTGTDTTQ
jgi:MarR family transcriptional regulator, 2-MHQ and catechol-resistance regulon repressor